MPRLAIDDRTIDLTGPGSNYRTLPCLPLDGCTPSAVEADVDAAVVHALAGAKSVSGVALGFPIRLIAADQDAIRTFAAKAGVVE